MKPEDDVKHVKLLGLHYNCLQNLNIADCLIDSWETILSDL